MAKGHELHQARVMALQGLGKDLARRAKSKCELTGEGGIRLHPYEVPPVPDEPDLDRTILVSDVCLEALNRPATLAGQQWRCLVETIWSEIPAVQVVAWRMLQELGKREDWAREALEDAFLDSDVLEWAEQAPLAP